MERNLASSTPIAALDALIKSGGLASDIEESWTIAETPVKHILLWKVESSNTSRRQTKGFKNGEFIKNLHREPAAGYIEIKETRNKLLIVVSSISHLQLIAVQGLYAYEHNNVTEGIKAAQGPFSIMAACLLNWSIQ